MTYRNSRVSCTSLATPNASELHVADASYACGTCPTCQTQLNIAVIVTGVRNEDRGAERERDE